MKKIMFNERFGLQQATFYGSKTLTHRIVPDKIMKDALAYQSHHINDEKAYEKYILDHAPYKVGEIVAVAQSYNSLIENKAEWNFLISKGWMNEYNHWIDCWLIESEGFRNKMFVKAKHMPHHIKITGIKVEGLAGISDEDCLKEGIYELKLCESEKCVYTFQGDNCGMWKTPYYAYKELIDRLNRRGFFESNPLTYAYEYKLID